MVVSGVFGSNQMLLSQWTDLSKDLKAYMKTLNTTLTANKFLSGNSLTYADIFVAISLIEPLQTVLDGGFRKAMKNVTDWLDGIYALPEFKTVYGAVQMCSKPMKPVCLPEPKVEKKEETPKPAPAKKAEKA